jgi:DNA-directed RNA polymerase subunit RPC12/RpoP
MNQSKSAQSKAIAAGRAILPRLANGLGGGVVGLFLGLLMIVIGILLCLTIIGAIIGIPMILAGVVMPFGIALGALGLRNQKCPYCQNKVAVGLGMKALTCRYCKKRLLVKDKELVLVD